MTADLPFIDEHSVEVPAPATETWRALTNTFGASENPLFTLYATLIGVDPRGSQGGLERTGSTRVGFRVSRVKAPELILLTGRHRFSEYSLGWTIEPLDDDHSRLSATTRARFPGLHGRAYKSLVIDSGAHARITRRMLTAIARRA